MFDKLKKLFKSKNKEVEHDNSTDRIEYTEKLNWGILPDNPSKVSMFQSPSGKNHDIIIVDFLYDLLTEKGWKVHMINDEEGMKWLYVPETGYYLLPLLNWVDQESHEGLLQVAATIQIHHKELFPNGIFEYQYGEFCDGLAKAIKSAFKSWVILDWETLVDAANPENAKNMNQIVEMTFDNKPPVKRHLFFGNVIAYPNISEEEAKKKGIDAEQYVDEFCPCCLFTKSIESFSKQMNNTGKNYAIRLFALKDVNGDLRADCRINGEEYPEAEGNLKKYAETWKKCDIIKFRKQYVIITDVKENLNYKEWRKQCQ